jgi:hypothetical protein
MGRSKEAQKFADEITQQIEKPSVKQWQRWMTEVHRHALRKRKEKERIELEQKQQ